jgi:hypothetical protein
MSVSDEAVPQCQALCAIKRAIARHGTTVKSAAWPCAAPFPMLPYGVQLLGPWKGTEVQQVAKKHLKVLIRKCTRGWYWKVNNYYKDLHSMCQWSCNNVSGGTVLLVKTS